MFDGVFGKISELMDTEGTNLSMDDLMVFTGDEDSHDFELGNGLKNAASEFAVEYFSEFKDYYDPKGGAIDMIDLMLRPLANKFLNVMKETIEKEL